MFNITNNSGPLRRIIESIAATLGGVVGFLFGRIDGFFWALVVLCVLDYVSGVIVAVRGRTLSSEIGFAGICKKLFIFILIAVAHQVDEHVVGDGSVVKTAAMFFFFSNEGISIMENAANMGVPIPKKLVSILQQIRKDEEVENQTKSAFTVEISAEKSVQDEPEIHSCTQHSE